MEESENCTKVLDTTQVKVISNMCFYEKILGKQIDLSHPAHILKEIVGLDGRSYDWPVLKQLAYRMGSVIKNNGLIFNDVYEQFVKIAVRAGWSEELIRTDIYRNMQKGFNK